MGIVKVMDRRYNVETQSIICRRKLRLAVMRISGKMELLNLPVAKDEYIEMYKSVRK
jgi:hypothetical protein